MAQTRAVCPAAMQWPLCDGHSTRGQEVRERPRVRHSTEAASFRPHVWPTSDTRDSCCGNWMHRGHVFEMSQSQCQVQLFAVSQASPFTKIRRSRSNTHVPWNVEGHEQTVP